jgi:hypothetical protein
VPEYLTVMVVGGGIGVTPVASTLKSVIYYRWKNRCVLASDCRVLAVSLSRWLTLTPLSRVLPHSIGISRPNHAYFYWVVSKI